VAELLGRHKSWVLQTEIEDLHLGNPVMRSYYKNGFAKHYVRAESSHRLANVQFEVPYCRPGVSKAAESNLWDISSGNQSSTERSTTNYCN
jgi:hypothetical protein